MHQRRFLTYVHVCAEGVKLYTPFVVVFIVALFERVGRIFWTGTVCARGLCCCMLGFPSFDENTSLHVAMVRTAVSLLEQRTLAIVRFIFFCCYDPLPLFAERMLGCDRLSFFWGGGD